MSVKSERNAKDIHQIFKKTLPKSVFEVSKSINFTKGILDFLRNTYAWKISVFEGCPYENQYFCWLRSLISGAFF